MGEFEDWDPFRDEPRTDRDILRECVSRLRQVQRQTTATNGRVTRLERFQWAVGGGLIVIAAIIAPIFVRIVEG